METETTILIITNVVVPIVVAVITGSLQVKKYNKEIKLLNVEHENRIKELTREYDHKIEVLELQHRHQQELETQRAGNLIVEKLTDKLTDKIIEQPATQKMINQRTTQSFLKKKRR